MEESSEQIMPSNYQVKKIITESDRRELKQLFDSLPSRLAHQEQNLFDVDVRKIEGISNKVTKKIVDHVQQGYKLNDQYFVKYEKDSFARVHQDNSKFTIITLVETQDLIGGITLVLDKYNLKLRPSHKYANRGVDNSGPYGMNIIPTIVPAVDGESILYDGDTPHGVTRVKQGYRIVLVSWFV